MEPKSCRTSPLAGTRAHVSWLRADTSQHEATQSEFWQLIMLPVKRHVAITIRLLESLLWRLQLQFIHCLCQSTAHSASMFRVAAPEPTERLAGMWVVYFKFIPAKRKEVIL